MTTTKIIKMPANDQHKKKIIETVKKMGSKKIMVIGDVGVDEYVMGEVRRISPEAPVPVLEVETEDIRIGLSGNVAQNIKSLGGEPILIGTMGKDRGGETFQELCKKSKIDLQFLVTDAERPTTRKIRFMAKHYHLVRVDFETRKFISKITEDKILKQVEAQIDQCESVIIQDYAKGTITESLVKSVVALAHKKGKSVFVDPHRSNNAEFYQGCDLIKPNFEESVVLSKMTFDELRDHPSKIEEMGWQLQKYSSAKQVVMTRGKLGMMVFDNGKITEIPTYARQVFDVTGAGDTVIAALALGLASGLSLVESSMMATFAAGVVVGQVGCVPCTTEQLIEYINSVTA
jgi:rfaE bifunctional protein kinase chain/domain